MSTAYNDGSALFGAATITFNDAATTAYDTEGFDPPSQTVKAHVQYDANDAPIKQWGTKDINQGSCDVQVPTAGTIPSDLTPTSGNLKFTSNKTSSRTFILKDCTPKYAKENYLICTISYVESIN